MQQFEVLNKKHNIVAADMPDRKRNGGICVIYGPYTDTIMINKDAFDPDKIAEVIGAYLDLKALGGCGAGRERRSKERHLARCV